MWFQTEMITNDPVPQRKMCSTKVVDIWQCSTCHNVIYNKTSMFNPLAKVTSIANETIKLQNVIIQIKPINVTTDDDIKMRNQTFVYCKFCKNPQELGRFKPVINFRSHQFYYTFIASPGLKKVQLFYSYQFQCSQKGQLQIFPDNINPSLSPVKVIKILRLQVYRYFWTWFNSKNFMAYYGFIKESRRKRKEFKFVREFVSKLKNQNKKKERNQLKSRVDQFKQLRQKQPRF